MEILQKLFAAFLMITAVLVLFTPADKLVGKVSKKTFKYLKVYLTALFVLLSSWLLSKSWQYEGIIAVLLVVASVVVMVKLWLMARAKSMDLIVNLVSKLSTLQLRLIALLQLLLAWILWQS